YVASAPNLEAALIRGRDCIELHESYSKVGVEHFGHGVRFSYRCNEQGNVGWRYHADMVLCVLVDVVRCFLGPAWVPTYIEVSYRRDRAGSDLEDHFGVPVLFDRPDAAIVFSPDLLDAPLLHKPCSPHVVTRADVVRQNSRPPHGFVGSTEEVVRQRLLAGQTDLDGAAAKLGIGPRTLQRRLSDEGTSYNGLLARCLRLRAAELVAEDALTMGQVSDALGFASQTHFARAFKRVTGITPGAYRKFLHGSA
ncbi:MAG: helix-turn-helix domain-containing protein, partial [Hyphomicrobiales bacterium]